MIVLVPGVIPVTIPEEPIMATAVLLLVHIPPPAVLPNIVVAPAHTCSVPLITEGAKFTIIVVVAVQPAAVV